MANPKIDPADANNIDELALQATDARQRLIKSGYQPIPTRAKQALVSGWNGDIWVKTHLTDNAKGTAIHRAAKWPRLFTDREGRPLLSTGSRLVNGLGAIDGDVDDEVMSQKLFEIIEEVAPDVAARAPIRYGKGDNKFAMFVRIEGDAFGSLPHSKFYRPGEEDGDDHCVEVFGSKPNWQGHCHRQFVVHGPHSYAEDGVTVLSSYEFSRSRPSLLDTPLHELPALTKVQALQIIDKFERAAVAHGWIKIERPAAADTAGQVYSITEETRFNTDKNGHGIDYTTLCEQHACYGDLRCASSFIDGRSGTKTSRCWVFWSERHQCVAVYVYGDEQTHYPVDAQPKGKVSILAQIKPTKVASGASAVGGGSGGSVPPPSSPPPPPPDDDDDDDPPPVVFVAPPRPDDNALMFEKLNWLIKSYGYCALSDSVIELYKPADDCQLRPLAFQRLYRAWRENVAAANAAPKWVYSTGGWEVNPARFDIEGVRMRPDMPFPIYVEDNRVFKNTYARPTHDVTGGDVAIWHEFLEHLLPDPIERAWFRKWLAHKHRHPGIPGVAVVMVANSEGGQVQGTGRGFLRDILARLFGPSYVRPIDFDVFSGRSAQGQFTDWAAYAVLVTVSEAKDTANSGRWSEQRAIYERIKEIVDPRAVERTFTSKYGKPFRALAFASYLIFSNNADAMQLVDGDRRVTALANGVQMSEEMAERLTAWLRDPANVAAVARDLEAESLAGFNIYKPLPTQTKRTMQDLARTELDEAYATVRKVVGSKPFTREQIHAAVAAELGEDNGDIGRWVRRRVRSDAMRLNDVRLPPSQGRYWVLCWRGLSAAAWKDVADATVLLEVEATGKMLHGLTTGMSAIVLNMTGRKAQS
jgi:hypothetical protein